MDIQSWNPSPAEAAAYDHFLTHADVAKAGGELAGSAAVAFFTKSGLDRSVLRNVWTAANLRGGAGLSRREFYIAMRLVALAQAGVPPTREALLETAARPVPLPVFAGIPPPPAPAAAAPSAGSSSGGPAPTGYGPITPAEQAKYDATFAQADSNGDGFVDGKDAVPLLAQSGLPRDVLRQVWVLSDVDKDGRLDHDEFTIAVHLVACLAKRGLPLPSSLPEALVPAGKRAVLGLPPLPAPATRRASAMGGFSPAPSTASSGGLSIDDAFGGMVDLPKAPAPAPAPVSAPPPTPIITPVPVVVVEPTPAPRRVSAPNDGFATFGGMQAAPVAPVPAPVAAPAPVIPTAPPATPVAPVEVIAAARDLESAMVSHVKRESQGIETRRVAVEAASVELKALEQERVMMVKQVALLRSQSQEEQEEYNKVIAAIQAARASLASTRAERDKVAAASTEASVRATTAKGVLAGLVESILSLNGKADGLTDGLRGMGQLLGEIRAATAVVNGEAAVVQAAATLHASAAETNDEEAAVMNKAIAKLAARCAGLEGEKAAVMATLDAAKVDAKSALAAYDDAVKGLEAARVAHDKSCAAKMTAKGGYQAAVGKVAAVEDLVVALKRLEAGIIATPVAAPAKAAAPAPTVVVAAPAPVPVSAPAPVVAAPVVAAPVVTAPVVAAPAPAPVPAPAVVKAVPAPIAVSPPATAETAAFDLGSPITAAAPAPALAPEPVVKAPTPAAAPVVAAPTATVASFEFEDDGFGPIPTGNTAVVDDWGVGEDAFGATPAPAATTPTPITPAAAPAGEFGFFESDGFGAPAAAPSAEGFGDFDGDFDVPAPAPAPVATKAPDAFGDFDSDFGSPAPAPAAAAAAGADDWGF